MTYGAMYFQGIIVLYYLYKSSNATVFVSAVRCMMYGFGDDPNPYSESVDLLEDMVIEYICEMVMCFLFQVIVQLIFCTCTLDLLGCKSVIRIHLSAWSFVCL